MKRFLVCLPLLLPVAPAALAVDAACEPFVAATEKGSQQPARHTVSEMSDGARIETIVLDGKFYASISGKWQEMKMDLRAAERKVNADVRSGAIKLRDCKALGSQTVDGIATQVVGYTLVMPGTDVAPAKAYIGKDGLIHALSSDGVKVRYRYTGVKAPKL